MPDESEHLPAAPDSEANQGLRQLGKTAMKTATSRELRWPFFTGLVFYLLAIMTEYFGHYIGIMMGVHRYIDADPNKLSFFSYFISTRTLVDLLSDMGSAFIVAWVVSVAIESSSRQRQEEATKTIREEIAKDVFQAVYQLKHDPDYVRAAIDGVLGTYFIRDSFDVSYKIAPLSKEQARLANVEDGRFIKLTVYSHYRIKNVTPCREHFRLRYGIPIRSGKLADLAGVRDLQIGDRTYSKAEIRAITEDQTTSERHYVIETFLDAGETAWVTIEAEIIKEISDAESLGMKLPTMRMTAKLDVEDLPNLTFGMRAYASSSLKEEFRSPDGDSARWVVQGPLLPWNSLVLWWRLPEDDGLVGAIDGPVAQSSSSPGGRADTPEEGKARKPRARRAKVQTGAIGAELNTVAGALSEPANVSNDPKQMNRS